jgi:hypothetical protein
VENRTWQPTAAQLRMNDVLVIHSGLKVDPDALGYIRERLDGRRVADVYARLRPGHVRCCVTYRGADTADCTPYDAPRQWHWRLVDPMTPEASLPMVGQQGIFYRSAGGGETADALLAFVNRYLDVRKHITAGM